jgi:hypothetical protein
LQNKKDVARKLLDIIAQSIHTKNPKQIGLDSNNLSFS